MKNKNTRFYVFYTLAGHTSARRFAGSYLSLTRAKTRANTIAGYGRVGIVVDPNTQEIVHRAIL
jgi:hypothetical protein